ncbi:MAG: methyltransferase domain-containing protein [Chlamydiales bacterium]|nr:methyltransferase domain-containing protein [Chlamydiales bacterium]
MNLTANSNSREIAFLALCAVHKEEGLFLTHLLPPHDSLAREIALGTERRLLTLDYIGAKLASRGALKLKLKEKMLLRMAIYQHLFMDRIPPHALVHEMVELARSHCHSLFVKFLNAALRKLVAEKWSLPEGDTPQELSICYSYPLYFVELLLEEYHIQTTRKILDALNQPPPLTIRERFKGSIEIDPSELEKYATSRDYYFQSATQGLLIDQLAGQMKKPPKRVIDLCAAPGGKLIALQEHFPHAELVANEISEKRLKRLRDNLSKYQIAATLTNLPAEEYPEGELFDLILLDVPCSNSGVLHKRPEARWRITPEKIQELKKIQWACLQKAQRLLAPGGEIWYTTCSILHAENEEIVARAARELSLKPSAPHKHLPHEATREGAFACRFAR